MSNLTFPLIDGTVLTVSVPRPGMLGESMPLSFYASAGELRSDMRGRLDLALPMTWSGPETELSRLVVAALGADHAPGLPVRTASIVQYARPHVPDHPYAGMSDDPWSD